MLRRPQAARLLALDREAQGPRLLLLGRGEAAIGSAEGSALRVADANLADRHATIRYARGRYYVVDLKSAPGTFVNGRRIRRTQRLKHGDTIRFGSAAPYRFIDPDALKRRRWRRTLRASALVVLLVAIGLTDHFEKWGLFSAATLTEILALVEPHPAPKRVDKPAIKVASAPTRPAAPSTISMPGPAEYAANVATTAAPTAASTPKSPASASTPKLAAATSTSGAAVASSSMPWLERINFYRAGLGLDPIRDNPEASAGAAAHARYLLLNFNEDIRSMKPMSPEAYLERPGKRGYSAGGARVAKNLQLAWGCSSYDAGQQIDRWIEGPFHRLAVFDPYLIEAGYGEASSGGCWVAALRLPPPADEAALPYARAIEFPPADAAVALDWIGLEAPDPLATCPGYSRPVGLPITLQIGREVDAKLSAHSLTEDGKPVEHCAFDAASYRNPNVAVQDFAHWNLQDAGAVVIVPRAPLKPGSRYAVSITADNRTYAWSFKTAETESTTFAAIPKFPTSAPTVSALATAAPIAPAMTEPTETPSPRPHPTARPAHRGARAPAASPIAPKSRTINPAPSSPTAEESSPSAGSSANWLTLVNVYRARLGAPPVEEDPAMSHACLAHVQYLMMNYRAQLEGAAHLGVWMHDEDKSKPGYSPEGRKAGLASDVILQHRTKMTDEQRMAKAIEIWISGPFHRPQILNPFVTRVGFGEHCEGGICLSAFDPVSGLPRVTGGRALPVPLKVPPDGVTVKPGAFGGEWPSPVASCPGYSDHALAITLQLGLQVAAKITDASLTQTTGAASGTKVATCAYDYDSYTNSDAGAEAHARMVLRSFGEVAMMVRDPLTSGETYRVAMTVNGKPYTWSFTVK